MGHDSRMYVRERTKKTGDIIRYDPRDNNLAQKIIINYRKKIIQRNYSGYKNISKDFEMFSSPITAYGAAPISKMPDADIYHLHWFTNFLDITGLFKELKKRGKPIVWTLHDMNPVTGGCHHDDDCGRYKQTCGRCPQLNSSLDRDLSRKYYELKRKAYSTITKEKLWIATDSNWLRECARSSSLFRGYRIDTVHYGLDTNIFQPLDKKAARKVLGIDYDIKVILFGAPDISNRRKGFHYLVNSMNKMSETNDRLLLLTFGDGFPDYKMKVPVKNLGPVVNLYMMAIIQNAADCFVIPSMREAFGQTCLEAMSCGTPVVGFNGGGIPDMIIDGQTGYLAIERDEISLAESLYKMVNNDEKRIEMGKKARQYVLENFSLDLQAEKYLNIYKQLLG
jgi:glycosyltransferase involved in cell wall biosynthesis